MTYIDTFYDRLKIHILASCDTFLMETALLKN